MPLRPLLPGLFLIAAVRAAAAALTADSADALRARLAEAQPGDSITVKDGVYELGQPLVFDRAGAPGHAIMVQAASVGGVEFRGKAGLKFKSPAAYVVLRGFRFTGASGQSQIEPGATHIRITRCFFACFGDGSFLTVSGDDAEIDHSEFGPKATHDNMISVTGKGSQVARRVWIHHNFFHDFSNIHENGGETIRFGLSGLSMSTGAGLTEYNLFLRCTGENEIITNKSCGNTYRYNSFIDSPGGEMSQRHGNDCQIYSNYFRNTQGIRIFGDRHHVYGNYLEGNSAAITIGNGDGEVADGAKLTSHDRPDYCVIEGNFLVNNKENYRMLERKKGLGATHTTFARNIIKGGGPAATVPASCPYRDPVWADNILWKTAGPGDMPAGSFREADAPIPTPHPLSPADVGPASGA